MDNDQDLKVLAEEVFDEYINDEMPIRLLHITKVHRQARGISLKLVNRDFIKKHFESVPKDIYESFRHENLEDREVSIRAEVKRKLKYAISSHRWLQKEPTHQDMLEKMRVEDAPEKMLIEDMPKNEDDLEAGWKKLEEFCRTALFDHKCEFAWSDTCCIDKSIHSVVDESIRSMFRWYRNSHMCIVFLSDTANLTALQESSQTRKGRVVDNWFLRGWTLQELLAPSQVKFYGENWKPLIPLSTSNDKLDERFMKLIHTITHIPLEDLRSFSPGTNRVPEKMLWASKRRTTRIEDIAYCLIGIFDVSLITAYGEGNRAFFRLMEEILKRYDNWDVFHWSGRCSRYNAALPDAPHCYPAEKKMPVGRKNPEEERNNKECDVGDCHFALTNHGLKIAVLKLDILLEKTRKVPGDSRSRYLTFWTGDKFKIEPNSEVKHIGEERENGTEWALGVLDYWIKGERPFIDSRQKPFTAFLLSWDKHVPRARWKKEMTEKIIEIRPSGHEAGLRIELYL